MSTLKIVHSEMLKSAFQLIGNTFLINQNDNQSIQEIKGVLAPLFDPTEFM